MVLPCGFKSHASHQMRQCWTPRGCGTVFLYTQDIDFWYLFLILKSIIFLTSPYFYPLFLVFCLLFMWNFCENFLYLLRPLLKPSNFTIFIVKVWWNFSLQKETINFYEYKNWIFYEIFPNFYIIKNTIPHIFCLPLWLA